MQSLKVHLTSHRRMHPADGIPITLDVLTGISENGTCPSGDGTRIDLYVQQEPFKDCNVCVLTLHHHMSLEYLAKVPAAIGRMKFQTQNDKSDAFLRISSMTTAANVKNPLVTFGNDASKAFLIEATPHIVDLEKDILKLTSYLHHLGEVVLKRALNIVKEILVQKEVKNPVGDGKGGYGSTPNDNQLKQHFVGNSIFHSGRNSETLRFKKSVTKLSPFVFGSGTDPVDLPNSVVGNLTRNKPYGTPERGHSDTRPLKVCNHDNRIDGFHEEDLQIATSCYCFPIGEGEEVPEKVLGMKHGIPNKEDGSQHYCPLVGRFSSEHGTFIYSEGEEWIPLGGRAHLHWQMPGGQGEKQHCFTPYADVFRYVGSPRHLGGALQMTKERQMCFFKRLLPVHVWTMHQWDNVLETMRGKNRTLTTNTLAKSDSVIHNHQLQQGSNTTVQRSKVSLPLHVAIQIWFSLDFSLN